MADSTLSAIGAALQKTHLADPAERLKPGGRAALLREIAAWAERGKQAYVVVLPEGASLSDAHGLWSALGLDESRDLLLLFNGQRWEARGWALSKTELQAELDAARQALKENYSAGLRNALERLGVRATRSPSEPAPLPRPSALPQPAPEHSSSSGAAFGAAGVVAALAATGIGWVVLRRRKLAKLKRESTDLAFASAERAHSDLVLAAEDLPQKDASELQLAAARLHDELERLRVDTEDERVKVARVEQIENELSALHSRMLQKSSTP